MYSDFCSDTNLHLYNIFGLGEHSPIKSVLFLHENLIEIRLKQEITVNSISVYRIDYERVDAKGNYFNEIITNFSEFVNKKQILIVGNFDICSNYRIRLNNEQANVVLDPRPGGILDTEFNIENQNDFGGKIIRHAAYFKLWSPPAGRVDVVLYNPEQERIYTENPLRMEAGKNGTWTLKLSPKEVGLESLDGYYYKYAIYAYGSFRIGLDPYALSMAAYTTDPKTHDYKAALIDTEKLKKQTADFKNEDTCKHDTDIIAYEINVRDYTIQPGVLPKKLAGTYPGFIKKSDYLEELGITHVQFLPLNKCFTLDETDREYTGNYTADTNYNWGYDPLNFFSPEGRYSTNPYNPYTRINELRELIDGLHRKKIGVILDVVFNHTYSAEVFECIAPGCYYRMDENYRISGHTGAGSGLESRRKSVRKFIIDALTHFVKFYKADGFRFDLMGFLDIETMRQIRNKVGHAYKPDKPEDLILQGEAWEFTDIPDGTAYTKTNHPGGLQVALFNDSFRDACTGHDSYPGYAQGNGHEVSRLATGIIAGLVNYNQANPFTNHVFGDVYNRFAFQPGECLNYFAIHDGLTLWDKINLSVNDEGKEQRIRIAKLAFAVLLTTQGRIILHGGDEILRTKPLAHNDKEKHRAMTSHQINEEEGTVFFHENSYASSDFTNMFRWERLENEYFPFATDLLTYVRGLIQIRKNISAFRLPTADAVNQKLKFVHPQAFNQTNKSFYNIENFTIHFINGVPNQKYYLVGELHPEKANPTLNPYFVIFDDSGKASISFTKEQIAGFNVRKWSRNIDLHFKLVKTPGKWDYLSYAYSGHGENAVSASLLNKQNEVTINLGIKDMKVTEASHHVDSQLIAFVSECSQSGKYKKVFVAHNSGSMSGTVQYDEINPNDWVLLADNRRSGMLPIEDSEAVIEKGKVNIPRHSTFIAAQKMKEQ